MNNGKEIALCLSSKQFRELTEIAGAQGVSLPKAIRNLVTAYHKEMIHEPRRNTR